jgi:1-phosphofructokinase family hexose kinase
LLTQAECESLICDFQRRVDESDLVILSGSLPRGFTSHTYAELASYVRHHGKRCLIDASGALMRDALDAQPFLVKPNRDEISELSGKPVTDIEAASDAVRELLARGVALPVVTLGSLGAIAGDTSGIWHAELSLEQVRNTVGSGDCLLAGMAVGIARDMTLEDILRLGTACGAANAQSEETGFVERRAVEALLPQVRIQRLA